MGLMPIIFARLYKHLLIFGAPKLYHTTARLSRKRL